MEVKENAQQPVENEVEAVPVAENEGVPLGEPAKSELTLGDFVDALVAEKGERFREMANNLAVWSSNPLRTVERSEAEIAKGLMGRPIFRDPTAINNFFGSKTYPLNGAREVARRKARMDRLAAKEKAQ